MDNDNEFNYSVKNNFQQAPKQPKFGFGSKVVVPFVSGVLGACLVGGLCFGIPTIRESIFDSDDSSSTSSKTSPKKTLDNSSYTAT